MKFSRLIAIACLSLLFAGPTWAQEEKQRALKIIAVTCASFCLLYRGARVQCRRLDRAYPAQGVHASGHRVGASHLRGSVVIERLSTRYMGADLFRPTVPVIAGRIWQSELLYSAVNSAFLYYPHPADKLAQGHHTIHGCAPLRRTRTPVYPALP
jgi:hypothetical protein